jgi:hypothetical protein
MIGYGDVIGNEKARFRVPPRMHGPLFCVSNICLSIAAFAAISEMAMAGPVSVSSSLNTAIGCSYGGLIPGGYFQGTAVPSPPAPLPVPCLTDSEIDTVANTFQSFTVHPGLSGQNGEPTEGGGIALPLTPLKSFVDAWAVNGGGGDATSLIYYAIVDAQTGQIDPNATIAMTFNAGVSVGADGFKSFNNAG